MASTQDPLRPFQVARVNHFRNEAGRRAPSYPREFSGLIGAETAAQVRADISRWPGYAPTPLRSLEALAEQIGVKSLLYKDEGERFSLKSFKALGGAYAVDELLLREIAKRRPNTAVTRDALFAGGYVQECREMVMTSATDGNHGRSVAWGAQRRGCPCVIYIHAGVSKGREDALTALGAEVIRIDGNYDDSVRQAAQDAETHGRFVVSDTSYEGYVDPPRDVMRGYTVMTSEIIDSLSDALPPTHIFVQGGVGGLAAAVIGHMWDFFGADCPRIVVVEPATADCLYQSAIAGQPVTIEGDLDTMMAGLSCGEVSMLAWPLVQAGADDFMTITDETIAHAMRLLASRELGAGGFEAGESAVAGLCAAAIAMLKPPLARTLGLGRDSRVLVFGTEGATDQTLYDAIVKDFS